MITEASASNFPRFLIIFITAFYTLRAKINNLLAPQAHFDAVFRTILVNNANFPVFNGGLIIGRTISKIPSTLL